MTKVREKILTGKRVLPRRGFREILSQTLNLRDQFLLAPFMQALQFPLKAIHHQHHTSKFIGNATIYFHSLSFTK